MFVYGSDDFLVDRRARALYDTYCPDGEIFQYDQKADLNHFIKNIHDALNTIPLFSPTNNLWIRGAKFLIETETGSNHEVIEQLLILLKNNSQNNIIILSASPIDKRKKTFKEFSQLADCYEVSDINEKTAYTFIKNVCMENNVQITHGAADVLQDLVGTDARLLKLELDKLATYIHGSHTTITKDDVSILIEASNYGNFFQQIEQFFSSDIDQTFDALDRYFSFNHESRSLLTGLQNRIRLIIQLRTLIDAKLLQPNATITAAQLNIIAQKLYFENSAKSSYNIFSQNPWYLSKLITCALKYSMYNLLDLQVATMDALAESAEKYDEQLSVVKNLAYKFKTLCATY